MKYSLLLISACAAVEIKQSGGFRPIEGTVPWKKDTSTATWVNPDWPVNYKVPDFGVDRDIINVTKSISSSEKKLKKTMNASFEAKKDPIVVRGYKVPDFGIDRDIIWSQASLANTEKKLGKKWILPPTKK